MLSPYSDLAAHIANQRPGVSRVISSISVEGRGVRKRWFARIVLSLVAVIALGATCCWAEPLESDERGSKMLASSPDLAVTAMSGPATAFVDENVSLIYTIRNKGGAEAGAYKVGLYLSGDSAINPAKDRLLKKVSFSAGLAAGTSQRSKTTFRLPKNIDPGAYYFGAVVDVDKKVAESKEVNNARVASSGTTIDRYQANDTVVTDHKTGLVWQNSYDVHTFDDALTYCSDLNLGGFTDWRLPRVDELSTIVDYSQFNSAIDGVFKCAPYYFWTSTPDSQTSLSAWTVDFYGGWTWVGITDQEGYFRCVRGGPYWSAMPAERMLNQAGTTVKDAFTGLTWQQTDGGIHSNMSEAKDYCRNLLLDGKDDWRLPTIEELEGLIDYSLSFPAHPGILHLTDDYYFSSTIFAPDPATVSWRLHSTSGVVSSLLDNDMRTSHAVCVRGALTYPGWNLYQGHSYKVLRNCGTWANCEKEAVSLGAHLVTINDQAETEWLVATFGGTEQYWIGYNDRGKEGTWVWAGGGQSSYTSWANGEPSNSGSGEDCAMTNWTAPGLWNDGTCSDLRSAIIEKNSQP